MTEKKNLPTKLQRKKLLSGFSKLSEMIFKTPCGSFLLSRRSRGLIAFREPTIQIQGGIQKAKLDC